MSRPGRGTGDGRAVDPVGSGAPAAPPRGFPTTRLEAFSDGVFAIVVTLLVLELEVPRPGEDLWRALGAAWPSFLGYVVSFAFVGGVWLAHSGTTRFLRAADAVLMRLNLLLLLLVSFLPFTTSLMATNLGGPHEDVAVVLFGLDLVLAELLLTTLVVHAARTPGIAADDVAEGELHAFGRERRLALLLLVAATLVGLVAPVAAVLVFLVITVALLVDPLRHAGRAGARRRR